MSQKSLLGIKILEVPAVQRDRKQVWDPVSASWLRFQSLGTTGLAEDASYSSASLGFF